MEKIIDFVVGILTFVGIFIIIGMSGNETDSIGYIIKIVLQGFSLLIVAYLLNNIKKAIYK